jgi:uncharacterized membrane protein
LLEASTDLQTALQEKLHLMERKLLKETLNMGMIGVLLAGTTVSVISRRQRHDLELL